jgi:hypothetical protein
MARRQFSQGTFTPTNQRKYAGKVDAISYRSSWELRFMRWCDSNPSVLVWSSEEIVIPYYSAVDQKPHRYFVDFLIKVSKRDGTVQKYLIEIKPHAETLPPTNKKSRFYRAACETYVKNQEKWTAATAWAKRNDSIFIVMTEYELGLAKRKKNG